MSTRIAANILVEKDPLLKGNHYAAIPQRGLLEIEGPDTAKFLQGLITNNMPLISMGGDGFYTSFLTPQGRLLYDTFIYPVNVGINFPHPKFIIDYPSSSQLQKHLLRYILRAKIKLTNVTNDYDMYHFWGDALHKHTLEAGQSVPAGSLVKKDERLTDIGCVDPRVPGFGYRAIVPKGTEFTHTTVLGEFTELPSTEYTIRRLLHGIPEGVDDMWPEQSLPLESNLDYMNGVDFRKGCYVGQELTIRTYHTGVVRKRIVPVQIYGPNEPLPTEISVDRSQAYPSLLKPQIDIKAVPGNSKRSAGKMCSGVHNVGLALMRLEQVQQAANATEPGAVEFVIADANVRLRPFLPDWWSQT